MGSRGPATKEAHHITTNAYVAIDAVVRRLLCHYVHGVLDIAHDRVAALRSEEPQPIADAAIQAVQGGDALLLAARSTTEESQRLVSALVCRRAWDPLPCRRS